MVPLWSFTSHGHEKQIFLNIALFVPLGFFLATTLSSSKRPVLWSFLSALFVSTAVEITQFLTYRGMLDVDDLISNCCGAAAGLLIYKTVEKFSRDDARKWTGRAMLTAGLVGCIIAAVPAAKSNISTRITQQFWFDVDSLIAGDNLILEGQCFTYDRSTPSYILLLGNEELRTEIDGENFFAMVVNNVEEKEELQIRFSGYSPMPTGIWIRSEGAIDYVAGDVVAPDGVPKTAILKAYSSEFDTFVYEDGDKLLWLIGWEELDKNTEIIYHLHTNESEKLPEKRVQYKFDNRGFRVGTDKEIKSIGHYRVFEDIIPEEYNVTAIAVGFNTEGTITWTESFRTGCQT